MPATGEPRNDAGRVAAGLQGVQADALERRPDRRHVLDADPVELHVLPVGDVRGAAGVGLADLADHPHLRGGQPAAVDADPEHEVRVVELLGRQGAGLAAVQPGLALGVEAEPAEPAAQVAAVDGGEPAVRVDVLDARPHVERVVVLLGLLVGVQRLPVAEGPLALAALGAGAPGPAGTGGGGGAGGWGAGGGGCHGAALLGERDARRTQAASDFVVERVSRRPRARLEGWAVRRWARTDRSCCACDRGPRGVVPRGASSLRS